MNYLAAIRGEHPKGYTNLRLLFEFLVKVAWNTVTVVESSKATEAEEAPAELTLFPSGWQ